MRAALLVLCAIAGAGGLTLRAAEHDGTAIGPPTTVGTDDSFLQTAAQRVLGSYEPHKDYNFTSNQVYRMTYTLLEMCQSTGGVSEPYVDQFRHKCEEDTAPVGNGDGPSRRWYKCDAFYTFVKELYCPYDPCVQLSLQSYKAHKAICGLLRCTGPEVPLPSLEDKYETPKTCPEYVNQVLDTCAADKKIEADHLCDQYTASFTKEGCEIVVERMQSTVAPMRLCDSWSCDRPVMPLEDLCEKVLSLNGTEPVVVPAHKYYLSQQKEPVPVQLEQMGINISRATLGYGEHCDEDHTNNILLRSRAQCQGLRVCKWDNPNVVAPAVLRDSEPGCEGNFALEYTCLPGGKKHQIFGPHTATYEQVPLDCTVEIYQATAKPLPLKSLAAFNPAPHVKKDVFEGTKRRENSFMTPELQKQRDEHMMAKNYGTPRPSALKVVAQA